MKNKTKKKLAITALALCATMSFTTAFNHKKVQAEEAISVSISRMDKLPSVAADYEYKDWKQTTIDYIEYVLSKKTVYDGMDAKGNSLASQPIKVAQENGAKNIDAMFEETGNTFWGIKSYLGLSGGACEGINCIAAILSASQVGLDMTNYVSEGSTTPRNYVRDMVAFYQADSGENVVTNNYNGSTGDSFWYNLLPGCLFVNLYEYYPQETYLKEIIVESSKKWAECVDVFGGANCNFNTSGYSVLNAKILDNGRWREPDAAAGIAYILYGGYQVAKGDAVYGELSSQFLARAMWCMDFLDSLEYSPFYEVLTFLAPAVASKMNVFHGKNYNIAKYINWTLDGSSAVRGGWGMINESWGGKHTYGLMGSLSDGGGYAFAMNTFDAAWGFIPTVKYDTRFANSIGKWILNASNASRYYYGENHSFEGTYITDSFGDTSYKHWSGYYQSSNYLTADNPASSFIAYEGLRKYQKGFHWNATGGKDNFVEYSHSPYASGDSFTYNWGGNTDYGLYGSSHVGMFGATIDKTNVEQILKIDLNALDYFGEETYPTYMFFNPYNADKKVEYTKSSADNRLYDVVNKKWVETEGEGTTVTFVATKGVSTVLAELPATGEVTTENGVYYHNGKYVASSRSSLNVNVMHFEDEAWKEISNGAVISNKIKLDINAQVDSSTSLESISVTIGGREVYYTTTIPSAPVEIDIKDNDNVRSGNGSLIVSMRLANGGVEKQTMAVTVAKSRLETAFEFKTDEDLTKSFNENKEVWNAGPHFKLLPFDCSVTTEANGTKITAPHSISYGSAFTEYFEVDISRTPVLEFDVVETSASWALKVFIEGGDNTGYYMIRDIDSIGHQTVNIVEQILVEDRSFDMEGVQKLCVWILPTGKTNCHVTVSNMRAYYLYDAPIVEEPNPYEWGFKFTPGFINVWEDYQEGSSNNTGAILEYGADGKEKISVTEGRDSGIAVSPFIYTDIAKNPVLKVEPDAVGGSYSIGVLFEGDNNIYELVSNANNANAQTITIASAMKQLYPNNVKSGMSNIRIAIILNDAESWVNLSSVSTYYQLTPWGTVLAGDAFLDWTPSVTNNAAGSITAVGNSAGDYRIKNTDNASNDSSIRGAAGKFEINLDRNPQLAISVANAQGKWGVSVVFFGDLAQRYEIIPMAESKNTQKVVNLVEAFKRINASFARTGVQSIYLQVDVVGGQNFADVRKITTSYAQITPDFESGNVLSGIQITAWEPDATLNTISYLSSNGLATIKENLKGSSAISTPVATVIVANNPHIVVNTEDLTGAWRLIAVINGEKYDLSPKAGYTQAGNVTIDLISALENAGYKPTTTRVKVSFRFECEGADSQVSFSSVRFVNKLKPVGKITVDGNVLSWAAVSGADGYSIVIADNLGNVIKETSSYASTAYDVTSLALADGVYKIIVTPYSNKAMSPASTSQGFKQGNVQSIQLGEITAIDYDGMFIRFDAIESAQGYMAEVKDVDTNEVIFKEQLITDNFIDLSKIGLPGFNYIVKIKAVGDDVAYLSSEYAEFEFATPTVARYTGKVLATFTPVNNEAFATVTESGSALLQLPTGGNWGEMGSSTFSLDMSKNPIWYIDFGTVTHGYYMRMYIDGTIYYITDNVFSSETVWFDIVGILRERGEAPASALTGVHNVRFCFGVTGGTADVVNPTVEILASRVFTVQDGYVQPILAELDKPTLSLTAGGVKWNAVDHATSYLVTVSNEYGVLYTKEVKELNIDLSFIRQPDTYVVTVFARGASYYDSEVSEINYVVSEEQGNNGGDSGCNSNVLGFEYLAILALVGMLTFIKRKMKYDAKNN